MSSKSETTRPAITLAVASEDRSWLAGMLGEAIAGIDNDACYYDGRGDQKHANHLRHRWDVVNEMIRTLEAATDV